MVEEFWDELVELLMPNLSICPRSINHQVETFIWESLKIQGFGWIDWNLYPQNIRIDDPSEIIPGLEKLLDRPFQESDQIIYILCMYDLDYVIKTRLEIILDNYADMPWTDKLWIWHPTSGYVIEDLDAGNIRVGLVPKQPDPYPHFIAQKDPTKWNSARLIRLLHRFTAQANTTFLTDDQANKILSFFQSKFPFTPAGKIDWDKTEKKIAIGRNPGKIIPALEQLLEKPVSMTAYINWCDPDLPLIKVDLRDALTRYDQIVAVAGETIIFNPTARYVIEINGLGDITVGVLEVKTW